MVGGEMKKVEQDLVTAVFISYALEVRNWAEVTRLQEKEFYLQLSSDLMGVDYRKSTQLSCLLPAGSLKSAGSTEKNESIRTFPWLP